MSFLLAFYFIPYSICSVELKRLRFSDLLPGKYSNMMIRRWLRYTTPWEC